MSIGNIARDSERFKNIVKGQIRQKENLKRYISRDELITKKGDETIRIPVPVINIPRFRYGKNIGGVAQGEGDIGDIINPGPSDSTGSVGSDSADSGDLMDFELSINKFEKIVF